MRTPSYIQFDDYVCEVRGHCHLNCQLQARGSGRCDRLASHNPEDPPQEHSAEHPTRFDDTPSGAR